MMGCPPGESLARMLAEVLPAEEQRRLEAHVETCPSCQEALQELTRLPGVLASSSAPVSGEPAVGARSGDRPQQATPVPAASIILRVCADGAASGRGAFPEVPGYEVLEELGRGGMGVVYKARQLVLNRLVALKMILAGELASPEQRLRFRLEAEMASRVRHPNVVQVYEVGEHQGRPFLAMELVEGGNLARRLARRPLPPWEAAALAEVLARAVHTAHQHGVVHRDLKPANILLASGHSASGGGEPPGKVEPGADPLARVPQPPLAGCVPKVTDFGLARPVEARSGLTRTGVLVGTPEFMAPEQVALSARDVGPATDVYALGATLYAMLTGRPPFVGPTPLDVVRQVAQDDPVPPGKLQRVPRDLEVICLKCLRNDPARRYPSAGELADDLRRFLDGRTVQARSAGSAERLWRWARRRPAGAALVALSLLVTLVGFPGAIWLWLMAASARDEVRRHEGDAITALVRAREAEGDALKARNASRRQSASLLLDKGLELARQGEVAEAVHWMLESLRTVPDETIADAAFRRLVRVNLASWGSKLHRPVAVLDTTGVTCAAFSPDGALVATGHFNGVIRLWDPATGSPRGPPLAHDHTVTQVAFSPDGRTLLAGYFHRPGTQQSDGKFFHWDVTTGKRISGPLYHEEGASSVAWHPDGKHFVSGGGRQMHLWEAATGKLIGTLGPTDMGVARVAFAPDTRSVLVATQKIWVEGGRWRGDGNVEVWDIDSRRRVGILFPTGTPYGALAFAPDGKTLFTGLRMRAGTLQAWDSAGRKTVGPARPVPGPTLLFAADTQRTVLQDQNGRVLPWDLSLGRPGGAGLRPGWGGSLLAAHPDGEIILHNSELWRLARDEARGPGAQDAAPPPELPPAYRISYAACSPDLKFAVTGRRGLGQLWDLATGVPFQVPLVGRANGLVLSPDGTKLVGALAESPGSPRSCRVWDKRGKPLSPILTHANQIGSLAFSPDSKLLAVGTYAWSVHLYDSATGKPRGQALMQNDIVQSLAFSPDSTMLAAGTATDWNHAPQTRLWDVKTGEPLGDALLQQGGNVRKLAFRPDGRALLACSEGETRLWDMATRNFLGRPIATSWIVPGPGFSPDGKFFLTGDAKGQLRLRDAATGEPLGPALAVPEGVTDTAFSPDARTLLVGAADGTTQLWDLVTLRPLGSPVVQRDRVVAVAWAPDGRTFFTTTAGSPPRAWPVPAPLSEADPERISACLEVLTTLRMDAGRAVSPLDEQSWRERRARWLQREGSFDTVFGPPLGDPAWHEAQARQAEEDGNAHAARWHLDRLIRDPLVGARSPDRAPAGGLWLLYARRARAHAAAGEFEQAASDAGRAARFGSPQQVREWDWHQLIEFRLRGQWATALWYADRLIAAEPGNWRLYAERAAIRSALGNTEGANADVARASLEAEADVLAAFADEAGRRREWEAAAVLYSRADQREPLPPWLWQRHALALVKAGHQARYRRSCAGLVGAAAQGPIYPREMGLLLRVCVLGPDAVADYQPLFSLIDRLRKVAKSIKGQQRLVLALQGALLYRVGRHGEAVARLKESVGEGQPAGRMEAAFLAMAYHKLGQAAEARRWLDSALAAGPRDEATLDWDTLEGWLLCREAGALLGAKSPK